METLDKLTETLLRFDTTSGEDCRPALRWISGELEAHGFAVATQPVTIRGVAQENLVARIGPDVEGGLVLSAHIDTVPYADQPGWTREPVGLTVEGDRLYGRGICDMKGFIAQCLVATAQLDLSALKRPLVMAITAEEEVGCLGAEFLATELPALLGSAVAPKLMWIGEPTNWAIYSAHKGIVQWTVTVGGTGGHSSLPQRGVNAISVAARAIEVIGGIQDELRRPIAEVEGLFPDAPCTTLNIGTIQGGTAANMIPQRCSFTVNYRPLPGDDPLAPRRRIIEALEALDLHDHGGGEGLASITHDDPLVVPPMRCAEDTPLADALAEVLGERPRGGAPYATDGGRFGAQGYDVLICGAGELSQAHQPDESMSRQDFERGPQVITDVVRRLCG